MAFNIRIYGLLILDNHVLVTHESYRDLNFTKFPGGGLEPGEGIKDCLVREFEEELGLPVKVGKLFYVNDFYQPSAFCKDDQIISFYYFVEPLDVEGIKTKILALQKNNNPEQPEWLAISHLKKEVFKFPIDQIVCEKLTTTILADKT
jgi:8-oxo-dGTP diphosphatase